MKVYHLGPKHIAEPVSQHLNLTIFVKYRISQHMIEDLDIFPYKHNGQKIHQSTPQLLDISSMFLV